MEMWEHTQATTQTMSAVMEQTPVSVDAQTGMPT